MRIRVYAAAAIVPSKSVNSGFIRHSILARLLPLEWGKVVGLTGIAVGSTRRRVEHRHPRLLIVGCYIRPARPEIARIGYIALRGFPGVGIGRIMALVINLDIGMRRISAVRDNPAAHATA